MKKYLGLLVMICIAPAGGADTNQILIIQQAEADAREDGAKYCGPAWGVMAFLGSFVATPLAGGFLTLVALGAGESEVPAQRLAAIQAEYDDPDAVAVYESRYRQTLTRIQHLKNAGSALAGTGICIGIAGIVIALLFGGMGG